MNYCIKCGEKNKISAKFCCECGESLTLTKGVTTNSGGDASFGGGTPSGFNRFEFDLSDLEARITIQGLGEEVKIEQPKQ